jgi:hypothetical protein
MRGLFAFPSGDSGGVSLAPLAYNTIDLTSGFTKVEPNGMAYSSVTIAGGINTLTFGELGTGDLKYAFSGSGAEWPRHHAPLNDSGGTRLTTDDSFLLVVKLSSFTFPTSADFRMAVGCCLDPSSTTTAAFDGYGIGRRLSTVSTAKEGLQVYLDSTNGNTAGFTYDGADTIYGTVLRTGTRHAANSVFGEASNASAASAQYTTKSTQTLTASQNWSLFVATSTTTSGSISAGESVAFKAEYQVIRLR